MPAAPSRLVLGSRVQLFPAVSEAAEIEHNLLPAKRQAAAARLVTASDSSFDVTINSKRRCP